MPDKPYNYSVDILAKTIFQREIDNINSMPIEYIDNDLCTVLDYLQSRIHDIDTLYGKTFGTASN